MTLSGLEAQGLSATYQLKRKGSRFTNRDLGNGVPRCIKVGAAQIPPGTTGTAHAVPWRPQVRLPETFYKLGLASDNLPRRHGNQRTLRFLWSLATGQSVLRLIQTRIRLRHEKRRTASISCGESIRRKFKGIVSSMSRSPSSAL